MDLVVYSFDFFFVAAEFTKNIEKTLFFSVFSVAKNLRNIFYGIVTLIGLMKSITLT